MANISAKVGVKRGDRAIYSVIVFCNWKYWEMPGSKNIVKHFHDLPLYPNMTEVKIEVIETWITAESKVALENGSMVADIYRTDLNVPVWEWFVIPAGLEVGDDIGLLFTVIDIINLKVNEDKSEFWLGFPRDVCVVRGHAEDSFGYMILDIEVRYDRNCGILFGLTFSFQFQSPEEKPSLITMDFTLSSTTCSLSVSMWFLASTVIIIAAITILSVYFVKSRRQQEKLGRLNNRKT